MKLVHEASGLDDPSIIGQACHIVAQRVDGPRGNSPLNDAQRDSYSNLILLCSIHHKLVDDQPNAFTAERLHEIKQDHETYVDGLFDQITKQSQFDQEIVAEYIDEYSRMSDLDGWQAWTSWLLGGNPRIEAQRFEELKNIAPWAISRIWPQSNFDKTQRALENFRRIAGDFVNTFQKHAQLTPASEIPRVYETKRFYRIEEWDEGLYSKLLQRYECHIAFIEDYVFELTRAANLICDAVRAEVMPSFRIKEGALLVTSGPGMSLQFTTYRPEYRPSDFPDLYPGFDDFNKVRLSRDFFFGTTAERDILAAEFEKRRVIRAMLQPES
ncbi:MAG TPA: HNH endonuclease signature motif containing protein [Edaphobacter sp.]